MLFGDATAAAVVSTRVPSRAQVVYSTYSTDPSGCDEVTFMFARYLLELSLVEFKMLRFPPSNSASSSLYLANKIMNRQSWNEELTIQSQYEEWELKICAKEMLYLFHNVRQNTLTAVKRKFMHARYSEVSNIQIEA